MSLSYSFANRALSVLPATRFFALKRILLNAVGIEVGLGTRICGGVKFYGAGKISFGKDCWLGIGATFYSAEGGDIRIGDRCDIAPEVMFHAGTHEIGTERRAGRDLAFKITVGDDTWIGSRAVLLAGVQLGDKTVVGAGAVLIKGQYEQSVLLGGVPAKVLRNLV